MSLIKCFECNSNISEYAEKCPTCGCPISVIKDKKDINNYLIIFNDGETINLIGIEDKISEKELNSPKLWAILENDYNADIATCSTIDSMFEFNNYEFPSNYQELYDAMCNHNQTRIKTTTANKPKCPTCGSYSISKITVTKKATKTFLFGFFGAIDVAGKTWKCNNCGSKW